MPTASAEQNMKQNVVVCKWWMCKWISQDGCFCSIDLFGRIDSCDICKEMGVLLGRLWQIIPLTDQLPGSKESVGGIKELFAYLVTMRCLYFATEPVQIGEYFDAFLIDLGCWKASSHALLSWSSRIASHCLGSLSISVVRQRVHILKMLCTLFGRAKYSLKGLRYWMVKPKSSFFLFFLEG